MYFIYNFLLGIWALAMIPAICFRAIFKKKAFPGLSERLGRLPDELRNGKAAGAIWIHACSVGEALSAQSLIDELLRRRPDKKIIMSVITPGGWKVARERYSSRIGEGIFYFPLDFSFIVSRVLKEISPSLLIIIDTEIWPNMLRAAKQAAVPVALVNGRMSERSYRLYRIFKALLKPVLSCYSTFLMKDKIDADRFIALGAPACLVRVAGNIKYDVSVSSAPQDKLDALDRAFGLKNSEGPLIVAGSTHPGEEEAIFFAFHEVLKQAGLKSGRLLIAPRHIERAEEVEKLAQKYGFSVNIRSKGTSAPDDKILLLDTLGELAAAYYFADVAFVGGTLVPIGGHSITEPAFFSKAIVVGPHMENFGSMAREFEAEGALLQATPASDNVDDRGKALADAFLKILGEPRLKQSMGRSALNFFEKSKGATKVCADAADSLLNRE